MSNDYSLVHDAFEHAQGCYETSYLEYLMNRMRNYRGLREDHRWFCRDIIARGTGAPRVTPTVINQFAARSA